MCNAYTDGACIPNPGAGGFCVVLLSCNEKNLEKFSNFLIEKKENISIFCNSMKNTTSSRMELEALYLALKIFNEVQCYNTTIFTDSIYLVKGFNEWIIDWKLNNWYKKNKLPLMHDDLWKDIFLLKKNINVKWVESHSNNVYNNLADKMAKRAIFLYER